MNSRILLVATVLLSVILVIDGIVIDSQKRGRLFNRRNRTPCENRICGGERANKTCIEISFNCPGGNSVARRSVCLKFEKLSALGCDDCTEEQICVTQRGQRGAASCREADSGSGELAGIKKLDKCERASRKNNGGKKNNGGGKKNNGGGKKKNGGGKKKNGGGNRDGQTA